MPTTIYHEGAGITIAATATTGRYVDGQPYIVITEATTITAISNPSNQSFGTCAATGGAMVNPVPMGTQGFCGYLIPPGHIHDYDAAKDISDNLPYTINPGDSLSVAILRHDSSYKVPAYKIVVFMFVAAAPAANSFRPGFYGTDRSLAFNESDLDWSVLKSLSRASIPLCPTQATIEDVDKLPPLPWHEWGSDWTASLVRPQINTGNTNAENTAQYSNHFGQCALWLNLDFSPAEKRNAAIQLVQYGIDMAAYHAAGGQQIASGSHQTGWKFPCFLAAVMLDDPTMLAVVRDADNFVEGNLTTWRINASDVGRSLYVGRVEFVAGDVGKYWWGIQHRDIPAKDSAEIADYQSMYGNVMGSLMAARVMGRESDWGWGIAFRYFEQHLITFGGLGGFFEEFYDAHYATLPAIATVTVPAPSLASSAVVEPDQTVTLAPDPWGHPVYYTTNGDTPTSTPSATNFLYAAPITASASMTIKAKAFPADYQDASALATIPVIVITDGKPAPPTEISLS